MKTAVVTGAPSGMGREATIQLREYFKGLDEIWIAARRGERLNGLDRQTGVPLCKFVLDLTRERDRDVLSQALVIARPQVRFPVNAAGFGEVGRVEELGLKSETGMVVLNYEALCIVTRMVLPYMERNSRIIRYASPVAFLLQPEFAAYAATKSFTFSCSRALNQELRSRRICMTVVRLGSVNTESFDITESTGTIPLYKELVMANPKRVVQKIIRDSIAGREISVYGITMRVFRLLCKVLPYRMLLAVMSFVDE